MTRVHFTDGPLAGTIREIPDGHDHFRVMIPSQVDVSARRISDHDLDEALATATYTYRPLLGYRPQDRTRFEDAEVWALDPDDSAVYEPPGRPIGRGRRRAQEQERYRTLREPNIYGQNAHDRDYNRPLLEVLDEDMLIIEGLRKRADYWCPICDVTWMKRYNISESRNKYCWVDARHLGMKAPNGRDAQASLRDHYAE
jgi:hypothetical protein